MSSRARRSAAALALGLSALTCGGCLSLTWQHSTSAVEAPEAWRQLETGEHDLTRALELLGAPLYVYEDRFHRVAMVWGQAELDRFGIRASSPFEDRGAANFEYQQGSSGLSGVLLLFDSDLRLREIREGFLRDLPAGRALRPGLPDVPAADARDETHP